MFRYLMTLAGAIAGFAIGAGLSGVLVSMLSSNVHDKGLETIMTAVFAGGPAGAVIGAIGCFTWAKRRRARAWRSDTHIK